MRKENSMIGASILYIGLGAVLFFFPDLTTGLICTAVGLLLLAYGAMAVLGFFVRRGDSGSYRFQFELILGIFSAVLGGLFLWNSRFILSILPVLFGLYILVDGLVNLKRGLDLRAVGYAGWTPALVMAVVSLALAAVILWNPFATQRLLVKIIGVTFLYQGAADLWAILKLNQMSRGK